MVLSNYNYRDAIAAQHSLLPTQNAAEAAVRQGYNGRF